MTNNLRNFTVLSFTFLGGLCIISGITMPKIIRFEQSDVAKLSVTQKKVSKCKSNEIKLKEITIQEEVPISTNVEEYLLTPDDIDEAIISRLKLDTSNVNISNIGSYTYTITYKKKIYNGTVNVIAKPLPQVESMTLNELSIEVGKELPKDIKSYIKEELSTDVINAIRLDTSNVDILKPGSYLYSVSYNGKLYTSTVTVYEPKSGEEILLDKTTESKQIENQQKKSDF